MSYEYRQFLFNKGMNRSVSPLQADKTSFYTLYNMRPKLGVTGVYEQTPRFLNNLLRTTGGTYWNGSTSVVEAAPYYAYWTDQFLGLTFSQYCAWHWSGSLTQIPIIAMTTQPTTVGVTGGCLLVPADAAPNVTLGQTYDVTIDAATTFKWRVNGGAWTTGVAIDMAGNAIDSGKVTLYWLANSGFTVNDTWSWTRIDKVTTVKTILRMNDLIYFSDQNYASHQMFVLDTTYTNWVIRSVGYRITQADVLDVYENHIFAIDINGVLINSDLNDLDVFIATDVNEADSYTIHTQTKIGTPRWIYPISGAEFHGRYYILTSEGLYYTDYAGLPTPFSIKRICSFTPDMFTYFGASTPTQIIATPAGIFLVSATALFHFDGVTVTRIVDFYSYVLSSSLYGALWHVARNEIIVGFATKLLIYNVDTQNIYLRSADFVGSGYVTMNIDSYGSLCLTSGANAYREDLTYANTPAYDSATGTAFATPRMTTQLLDSEDLAVVKDVHDLYQMTKLVSGAASTYSTGANLQLGFAFITSNDGSITDDIASQATWINTAADAHVSLPAKNYRALAVEIKLVGLTSGKPPADVNFYGLSVRLRKSIATR